MCIYVYIYPKITSSNCCRFFVFFIILTLSIVSIYVITVVGKSQAGNQLSYIGTPSCDPVLPDSADEYVCYAACYFRLFSSDLELFEVNTAANWTKDYAVGGPFGSFSGLVLFRRHRRRCAAVLVRGARLRHLGLAE